MKTINDSKINRNPVARLTNCFIELPIRAAIATT